LDTAVTLGRLGTSLQTGAILVRAGVVRFDRPDKLIRSD